MRVLSVYPHGFTMGTSPANNAHKRALRGECSGWSDSSARSNINFLRSVKVESLTGRAYALTLTIKNCPPTPADWHTLRRNFIKRLERLGLTRFHWVTEWQRRGVPHLHGAFWLPDDVPKFHVINLWLQCAAKYGASSYSQTCKAISDNLGWFKYLAKHGARGSKHYQRSSENVPPQWQSKTGRMWGYGGQWDRTEKTQLRFCDRGFFMFRRIARRWRIADARAFHASRAFIRQNPLLRNAPIDDIIRNTPAGRQDRRRIVSARSMLKCNLKNLSAVRGLSEWLPAADVEQICLFLAASGYTVEA